MRAELLLLSPSFLVPCLTHDGIKVWDTLAIAEYLNEIKPEAGLLPADARRARALPRDLRRDAFGLRQPALGAADEPQGALSGLQGLGRRAGRHRPHRRDLARMPRGMQGAVPVRREARHGGRDVRAGGDALHDLRRASSTISDCARLLEGDHGDAGRCRNGSRAARRPSRTRSVELDVEF